MKLLDDVWNKKLADSLILRPGEDWNDFCKRRSLVNAQIRSERAKAMTKYPFHILRYLVVVIGESLKESTVIQDEDIWEDVVDPDSGPGNFQRRYLAVNTPQIRYIVHTLLSSIKVIPRSWGRSAALRYWRGIGEQVKVKDKYPGFGILSTENGWSAREADVISHVFYSSDIGSLLIEDYSEAQVDAVREAIKEGEDIDYGVKFCATRKEKNEEFIKTLMQMLENEGIQAPITTPKDMKEYVKKPLKIGQKVEQKHLKDLQEADWFRWTVKDGVGGVKTYEMTFVERTTGKLKVRPILKGKAFEARWIPSGYLYGTHSFGEMNTEYLGKWVGDVIEVPINWKLFQ